MLKWHSSIEKASAAAATQYRPVFVLFSAPGCGWCHRLKREVLATPAVRSLLANFSLALVDIVDDPKTAKTYGVTSVPRILILSANGTVRADHRGYLPPQNLQKLLANVINPALVSALTPAEKELNQLIVANKVPDKRWPAIMLALGASSGKQKLRTHVLAMKPFPHKQLVPLLDDSRLAVRLGALEILEEVCGKSFGFDPWLDPNSVKDNQRAVKLLKTFFTKEKINEKTRFSGLSAEQIDAYIRDVISDDRQRSFRAMRMLQNDGEAAAVAVAEFLDSHPQLALGMRRRIKELQYSLYIPAVSGIDPARAAHQLVFGTLDIRLQAIAGLKALGNRSVPILREFLTDPDPIIREACIDTMAVSGQRHVVIATFKSHLKTETDTEVTYAVLKGLAQFRSKSGLAILVKHLTHKNEDLVSIAIKSIVRLKTRGANAEITTCLSDPRWRIRVAALEAVSKLKIQKAEDKVIALLQDKDSFVCNKAIQTLSELDSKKSSKHLEKIFLENDEMKAPAVAGLTRLDKPLPKSFLAALKKADSDIVVAVLMSMEYCKAADLAIPAHFAQHKEMDVSCSAIRLLAARGAAIPKYRAVIIKALESDDPKIVRAAVSGIDLDKDLLKRFGISFNPKSTEPKTTERTVEDDLFDAFEETKKKPKEVTSDDVFGDFVDEPSDAGKQSDNTLADLIAKLEAVMSSKHKDDIKMTAALKLAEIGEVDVDQLHGRSCLAVARHIEADIGTEPIGGFPGEGQPPGQGIVFTQIDTVGSLDIAVLLERGDRQTRRQSVAERNMGNALQMNQIIGAQRAGKHA